MRRGRFGYSRGKWEVTRERFRIESETPLPPSRDALPLGGILASLLEGVRVAAPDWRDTLREEWPRLVGDDRVARHVRPGPFEGDRLVVYVENPVWMQELASCLRTTVLRRLRERFGANRISALIARLDSRPPDRRSAG